MATLRAVPPSVPPSASPPTYEPDEARLFLIPVLIGILRWLEEGITALSGYGIVFALAVGVVDLLTDGGFTAGAGWVDYAYAWAMALGIAGQIVGLSARSSSSFQRGAWLRGLAFTVLVLALAYVEYQAGVIFAYHKTFGTPVVLALGQVGLTQSAFIQFRTGTAVALAVLSGFLRYQPRRTKSVEEIEAENERKTRIAASNARARQAQLGTLFSTVTAAGQSAAQTARSVSAATVAPVAPTGVSDQDGDDDQDERDDDQEDTPLPGTSTGPGRGRRSPEQMDVRRAQMLSQGYPLADLTEKENERVFGSLIEKRRQAQVLDLLGWTADQYETALRGVRRQRQAAGAK